METTGKQLRNNREITWKQQQGHNRETKGKYQNENNKNKTTTGKQHNGLS